MFGDNCNARKKFSKEKFKVFHPGSIGGSLLLAKDIITGSKMPIISHKKNFKDALRGMNQKFKDSCYFKNKYIESLITDGDLRRELKNYDYLKKLIDIGSKKPLTVNENIPASKALAIMNSKFVGSFR